MEVVTGLAQGAVLALTAAFAGLAAVGASRAVARAFGLAALLVFAGLYLLRAMALLEASLGDILAHGALETLDTRTGRGLAGGAVLLAAALLLLGSAPRLAAALCLPAALAPLAAAHAFAAAPLDRVAALAFTAHAVLALTWFGGLAGLAALSRTAPDRWPAALRRFSRLALPGMAATLASGLWLAVEEGGGPALAATPFGGALAVKLAALAGALACAARLRARRADPSRGLLALETAFGLAVMLAAGVLSQMEPGAHADFDWPLPFRFAPAAAFAADPGAVWRVAAGGALGAAGLAAAALRRWPFAALGLAAGLALALPAVATPAFPTTYRRPPVPFDAATVARGARVFATNCAPCHGRAGHGDGPDAKGLNPAPADLTAPHTTLHTMGDMYWWVAKGYPGSAMPGFAARLDDTEIWSVVTYAMALSQGHRARPLGERIAPRQPWLHALEFPVADGPFLAGASGRARLVVLRGRCGEAARAFAGAWSDAAPPDLTLAVADAEPCPAPAAAARAEGAAARDALAAYALYRRSLSHPDTDDREGPPEAMALLIDRFGFVRARWRSDEDWPPAPAAVRAEAAALDAEPEIDRRGPHEH